MPEIESCWSNDKKSSIKFTNKYRCSSRIPSLSRSSTAASQFSIFPVILLEAAGWWAEWFGRDISSYIFPISFAGRTDSAAAHNDLVPKKQDKIIERNGRDRWLQDFSDRPFPFSSFLSLL